MASSSGAERREGAASLRAAAGRGGSGSPSWAVPDRSFPRSCRLKSRREFVEVYSKGRRVGSSSFTIFGLPNNLGHCRLGLTVSRKVGNAVRRSRVKRVLRELFRLHRAGMEPALDLVVNAYPSIAGKSFEELEQEFLSVFSRLARRRRS